MRKLKKWGIFKFALYEIKAASLFKGYTKKFQHKLYEGKLLSAGEIKYLTLGNVALNMLTINSNWLRYRKFAETIPHNT